MTTFKGLPVALQATVKEYLASNKNLTILNGKKPIKTNWPKLTLSEDEILTHKGNLGWVLGADDLVLDIDPQNDGTPNYERLVKDLGLDLEPTVNTPSGGFHIYMKIPKEWQGKKFHKTLNDKYKGVDFLTVGSQAVIAGSSTEKGSYTWADDLFGSFTQTIAPEALLRTYSHSDSKAVSSNSAAPTSDLEDFNGLIGGKSANWPEEKVLALLDKLDPSMTNGDWVTVGMGLQDWHPVDGLTLFENWSKGGKNYTEGETAKRWKSFKVGHGVTLGSLVYMANAIDTDSSLELATKLIDEINNADEKAFRKDIIPKIKKAKIDDFDRNKLVKAYQDKAKELTGIKPPIAEVRRKLASNDSTATLPEYDANNRPAWTNEWVYTPSLDRYLNVDKLDPISSNAFNIINGKHIPYNDGGTKPNANKYVADRGILTVVDSMQYLPTHDEFICQIGNQTVVNTFNKKSVPTEDPVFTDDGRAAIALVEKHIKFVFTTDEDAAIFTQWLAHQIQYTGKLIGWAPFIQSIQGVGKSYFAKLLRLVLGVQNVGVVNPTEVTSSFNSWAYGKAINVLDEIKIDGKNRFEAVNALKPLITDDRIQINTKGLPQFEVTNVTNYVCFTNHKDAVPTSEDDRRWWKISCEIGNLKDLPQWVGESEDTYYKKLHRATEANGGQLRKWLLEYPITDEFKAIKRAPETEAKRAAHATEEAGVLGLLEVKELLETGDEFYNKECVSASDLLKKLIFDDIDINLQEVGRILKRLNYQTTNKQVRVSGQRRRFWTKKTMTDDQIRNSLEKTAPIIDDPFEVNYSSDEDF